MNPQANVRARTDMRPTVRTEPSASAIRLRSEERPVEQAEPLPLPPPAISRRDTRMGLPPPPLPLSPLPSM